MRFLTQGDIPVGARRAEADYLVDERGKNEVNALQ